MNLYDNFNMVRRLCGPDIRVRRNLVYNVATNRPAVRVAKSACGSSVPCCKFLMDIGAIETTATTSNVIPVTGSYTSNTDGLIYDYYELTHQDNIYILTCSSDLTGEDNYGILCIGGGGGGGSGADDGHSNGGGGGGGICSIFNITTKLGTLYVGEGGKGQIGTNAIYSGESTTFTDTINYTITAYGGGGGSTIGAGIGGSYYAEYNASEEILTHCTGGNGGDQNNGFSRSTIYGSSTPFKLEWYNASGGGGGAKSNEHNKSYNGGTGGSLNYGGVRGHEDGSPTNMCDTININGMNYNVGYGIGGGAGFFEETGGYGNGCNGGNGVAYVIILQSSSHKLVIT